MARRDVKAFITCTCMLWVDDNWNGHPADRCFYFYQSCDPAISHHIQIKTTINITSLLHSKQVCLYWCEKCYRELSNPEMSINLQKSKHKCLIASTWICSLFSISHHQITVLWFDKSHSPNNESNAVGAASGVQHTIRLLFRQWAPQRIRLQRSYEHRQISRGNHKIAAPLRVPVTEQWKISEKVCICI